MTRQHAPATERNRDPILAVLRRLLPPQGTVIEIASGTGEHAAHFAAALPGLVWQPSDPDPAARASIAAWTAGLANVLPPLALDAAGEARPEGATVADAIVCINMIHIAPWAACQGLMREAGRLLRPDAPLILYGAFRKDGRHTAPSNEAFEAWLKGLDPRYGVRDLADVTAEAVRNGLVFVEEVAMPANNFVVVFRKEPG